MSINKKSVCFIVNNQIIDIQPPDDFTRKKWQDPEYAITRITKLVDRGRIDLAGEAITSIISVNDDSEQITIYEALATDDETDHVSQEVIYDSPAEETDGITPENKFSNNKKSKTESNSSTKSQRSRTGDEWGTDDTKFILDEYIDFMDKVGPMKTFKNKKAMWHRISIDFAKKFNLLRTPVQIENGYKTVLRRKKDAVNNNSKSGNSRQDIPFESELSKIAAMDDSVEPELLRTAKNLKVYKRAHGRDYESDIKNDSDSSEDIDYSRKKPKLSKKGEGKPKRKRNLSNLEIIQQLHHDRERAKQRRHVEKMNLIKKLFGGRNNSDKSSSDNSS